MGPVPHWMGQCGGHSCPAAPSFERIWQPIFNIRIPALFENYATLLFQFLYKAITPLLFLMVPQSQTLFWRSLVVPVCLNSSQETKTLHYSGMNPCPGTASIMCLTEAWQCTENNYYLSSISLGTRCLCHSILLSVDFHCKTDTAELKSCLVFSARINSIIAT